jgi:tetratricopeptide (TPR) repeat protein
MKIVVGNRHGASRSAGRGILITGVAVATCLGSPDSSSRRVERLLDKDLPDRCRTRPKFFFGPGRARRIFSGSVARVTTLLLTSLATFGVSNACRRTSAFDVAHELALSEMEQGKREAAAVDFNRALALRPSEYVLYEEMARNYAAMGRYDLAKAAFMRGRKAGWNAQDSYIQEGYFNLIQFGNEREAEKIFRHSIAVDTSSPFGYAHLGEFLRNHHHLREAESSIRTAGKLLSKRDAESGAGQHVIFLESQIFRSRGNYDQAASKLLDLLQLNPEPCPQCAHLADLGDIYFDAGNQEKAGYYYAKSVDACLKIRDGRCRRGRLGGFMGAAVYYASRGRFAKARRWADRSFPLALEILRIDLTRSLFQYDWSQVADSFVDAGAPKDAEAIYGKILQFYHGRSLPPPFRNLRMNLKKCREKIKKTGHRALKPQPVS